MIIMNNKKLSFLIILTLLVITSAFAKIDTAWVRRFTGPDINDDEVNAIAVDNEGNVYITGKSFGGSVPRQDYVTIKYNRLGEILWNSRYNGTGNRDDEAKAIAIDNSSNVYVTGYSFGTSTRRDYLTIKYNPVGETLWTRRYGGSTAPDEANAIAVDNSGNVCVTGRINYPLSGADYTTIKYRNDGETLWVRSYNGPGSSVDEAKAIAVDNSSNVYVTGYSFGLGTGNDFATIKYDPSGGTLWTRRYDNNLVANSDDGANAIVVDSLGNVYVTGYSLAQFGLFAHYDFLTIKYSPSGEVLWSHRYNGSETGDDKANAMAIDDWGNVYVTGYSAGIAANSKYDYATIKYSSTGEVLWVRRYDGPANDDDEAKAIALDSFGNAYVTGYSVGIGTSNDYATIKYSPSGEALWERRYDGPENSDDEAKAIAVDAVGNTHVSGFSTSTSGRDYLTIKYFTRDIGVLMIISPTDILDSTATIVPQARVKNYGTTTETFDVTVRISGPTAWSNTKSMTLGAGIEAEVNFDPWMVGPRGGYTIRCSTYFTGDMIQANDTLSGSFTIIVHDVGTIEIIEPTGSIDSTITITPKAVVKNFGTEAKTFDATFSIIGTTIYSNTQLVADLGPDEIDTIIFEQWYPQRGNWTTKCSTELVYDMVEANDKKDGSCTIIVHDVGLLEIVQPNGIVDSAPNITPKARIKNFGTENETFDVTFMIGTYLNSINDLVLNAGKDTVIDFVPWPVGLRGDYTARCSTYLITDNVSDNDTLTTAFTIRVRDYAVSSITSPISEVDSGSIIIPKAWIHNYGTIAEIDVPVTLYIVGTSYASTKSVSLGSGESIEQEFDPWTLNIPRGAYTMRCTTQLDNDLVMNNNLAVGSFTVIVYDVGVTEIIYPTNIVDSTATITPHVKVKNFGNKQANFYVKFSIGTWSSQKEVSILQPEQEVDVFFDSPSWTVGPCGKYQSKCSTELFVDLVKGNDKKEDSFFVRVKDYRVISISSPIEPTDSGLTITPKAWIQNNGITNEVKVPVTFYIVGTTYTCTESVSLNVNQSIEQTFDNFVLNIPTGVYIMRCTTQLDGDAVPHNDLATRELTVFVPKWEIRKSLPTTANKNIKDGGALTVVNDIIYALQGGNTRSFYAYYPLLDSWVVKRAIPLAKNLAGRSINKNVKAGGALASHNGIIYAFKGNNTSEFWAYYPAYDSWQQKRSIIEYAPGATQPTRVKAGGALTAAVDSIYAFKGGNTNEFWVYDIQLDTWYYRKPLITSDGKKIKGGAALTAQGCTLYALVGGNTFHFYAYIIPQSSWVKRCSVSFGSPKTIKRKIKDGAALAEKDGAIFALKGANTKDFGLYHIANDRWYTKETMPGPVQVKSGGALTVIGSQIYAFVGGNTNQFWRYLVSTVLPLGIKESATNISVMEEHTLPSTPHLSLNVYPNPVNNNATIRYTVPVVSEVSLKLYDALGKLVETLVNDNLNVGVYTYTLNLIQGEIPAGVYFLRYEMRSIDGATGPQDKVTREIKLIIN